MKQVENKKREIKAANKVLIKKSKENHRSNRDEGMDLFAVFYKGNHSGLTFKEIK